MVSTASTNALPMNCPWRNKLSPSPRPRRGVHIVKVCPVDNIYLLCYTATCLSSIAGAGYSSPFPSHQGVHTRWFGRALEWHSRGQRFDPAYLHQKILKPWFQDFFFLPGRKYIASLLTFSNHTIILTHLIVPCRPRQAGCRRLYRIAGSGTSVPLPVCLSQLRRFFAESTKCTKKTGIIRCKVPDFVIK